MIVFDLDGCLIDSEEMIRESYREAGAEAPADFLSFGHHDWIGGDRDDVHARKNAAYLRRLRAGKFRLLPAWGTAGMLKKDGHTVALLTGAPRGVIMALMLQMTGWPFTETCSGATPAVKEVWLADRSGGVYVDDQEHVTMPDGWRFVHYTGQDADQLYEQVTR